MIAVYKKGGSVMIAEQINVEGYTKKEAENSLLTIDKQLLRISQLLMEKNTELKYRLNDEP